jgi:hypothetical protein
MRLPLCDIITVYPHRIVAASGVHPAKRTGEGVRGIAKRFGVDPFTVQRISRPFDGAAA